MPLCLYRYLYLYAIFVSVSLLIFHISPLKETLEVPVNGQSFGPRPLALRSSGRWPPPPASRAAAIRRRRRSTAPESRAQVPDKGSFKGDTSIDIDVDVDVDIDSSFGCLKGVSE